MDWVCLFAIGSFGLVLGCMVGMTSIGKGLIGTTGLILLGVESAAAVGTVGLAGVFMMLSSTVKHYRNKNVHMHTVWTFSVTAVPASYFFATYKGRINEVVPLTDIIAVAIILSVITLVYKFFISSAEVADKEYVGRGVAIPVLLGAVLGFFIGATSISGSLIVIAFMLVLKMSEKLAIGTTNFVAIFSLIGASVGHVMSGHVDWLVLAVFTPMVMIGAYGGAHYTSVMPKKPLRIIILALLFVAAVGILCRREGAKDSHASEDQTEAVPATE